MAIDADRSRITTLTVPQNAFRNETSGWVEIEGYQFGCVFLKNELCYFREFHKTCVNKGQTVHIFSRNPKKRYNCGLVEN